MLLPARDPILTAAVIVTMAVDAPPTQATAISYNAVIGCRESRCCRAALSGAEVVDTGVRHLRRGSLNHASVRRSAGSQVGVRLEHPPPPAGAQMFVLANKCNQIAPFRRAPSKQSSCNVWGV